MNRQQISPEALQRIHELARARALQLRNEAIDAFFARCAASVRRALRGLRIRRGFITHVEA